MVAPASVQYVSVNPGVEPAVTDGAVRSTVAGAQTEGGLVIIRSGIGFTVRFLLAETVPHEPPLVVRVKVTDAGAVSEAVYIAVFGVAPPLLAKLPPAPPSDQTAAVALPPNEPPSGPVVPPWQIAATAPPASTVGRALTVTFLLAEVVPQDPPLVVRVSDAVPV